MLRLYWLGLCFLAINYFFIALTHAEECEIEVDLTRHIENEGFHRELHASVEILTNYSIFSECILVQREVMPAGVYVNPDELAELQRSGQLAGCVGADVNTEAPKETSDPLEVFIYYTLKQVGNKLSGSVILPFHLRYHNPLPAGGDVDVLLDSPSLLLKCNPPSECFSDGVTVAAPCIPCSSEKCYWNDIPYKTDSHSISLKVPVGSVNQYYTVLVCTLVTTCAGSLYIIKLLATYHWV